jgi:hypothetical protein
MSEQQVKAGKVDEAEEVLDVVFPSSDEAAEVMHPDEEPFHPPAPAVAAHGALVLGVSSFRSRAGCDHFDGYFSGNSRHCAPVPNTQSTPFSTARVSGNGLPRLSARRIPRNTGSTISHCSSVNSQRPAIGSFAGSHRAITE